jgi:ribosomal protein L28
VIAITSVAMNARKIIIANSLGKFEKSDRINTIGLIEIMNSWYSLSRMNTCANCGKSTVIGKSGVHRYGGGWARRAQKTSRIWKANLHHAKLTINGKTKTVWLCTKCLRKAKKEAVESKKTQVVKEEQQVSPATS